MRRALLICMVLLLALASAGIKESVPVQAAAEKRWILIELDRKRLTLYEGKMQIRRFAIASGAWDTPSPIGTFRVSSRFKTEMSGFGTRFLGLDVPWGTYGIHGTNKPGSIGGSVSHGCIRLRVRDAEELYDLVPNGTLVVIEGGPYGLLGDSLRTLKPGDRNSHVMLVQRRLKQFGFYHGAVDGIYGAGMSRAVLAARKTYGLSQADIVDTALYTKLHIALFE